MSTAETAQQNLWEQIIQEVAVDPDKFQRLMEVKSRLDVAIGAITDDLHALCMEGAPDDPVREACVSFMSGVLVERYIGEIMAARRNGDQEQGSSS